VFLNQNECFAGLTGPFKNQHILALNVSFCDVCHVDHSLAFFTSPAEMAVDDAYFFVPEQFRKDACAHSPITATANQDIWRDAVAAEFSEARSNLCEHQRK
jgi:hypothetical protein